MVKKKARKNLRNKEAKLRTDFYRFQHKVNHLNEFNHELTSLEARGLTKGFEKEVGILKSRLKDTTALPEIERKMRALRVAIRKKREVKKKSPIKKIQQEVSEISDSMDDTRKQLRREIQELKIELDKNLGKKGKVDSDVNLSIDNQMQNFIHSVKIDLSKKLKDKEKKLNEELKNELQLRRKNLESSYRDMQERLVKHYQDKEKNLQGRYKKKLDDNLKREIQTRFANELRKKFNLERARLDSLYVSKIKERYHEEYDRQKRLLEARLEKRLKSELVKNRNIKEVLKKKFKKQFSEEAHDNLVFNLANYRKRINDDLKKEFADKINHFIIQYKKQQDKELEQKTKELNQVLLDQQHINNNLVENLSEKKFMFDQEKTKIRKLINDLDSSRKEFIEKISRIRHEEAMKRQEDHKNLIEKNRREVANLTDRLKKEYHKKFDSSLKRIVSEEKQKLQRDYEIKRKNMKARLKKMSFWQRRAVKKRLNEEYKNRLQKNIIDIAKNLQDRYRKEFGMQANQKIVLEKKRLENKLKAMDSEQKSKENKLKIKEKSIIEREKTRALEIAGEKDKIEAKLILFREQEKIKLREERIKIQRELASKIHAQMEEELKRRENFVKAKLEKQFDSRLQEHLKSQEQELTREKEGLAKELQKKAQALLG